MWNGTSPCARPGQLWSKTTRALLVCSKLGRVRSTRQCSVLRYLFSLFFRFSHCWQFTLLGSVSCVQRNWCPSTTYPKQNLRCMHSLYINLDEIGHIVFTWFTRSGWDWEKGTHLAPPGTRFLFPSPFLDMDKKRSHGSAFSDIERKISFASFVPNHMATGKLIPDGPVEIYWS